MIILKEYIFNLIAFFIIVFSFGFLLDSFEKNSFKYLSSTSFGKVFARITSYIGTPIHEFGHFIFAILFLHNIESVAFFPTKETLKNGQYGYVNHSFRKGNFYQNLGNLFIGIGPMISGPISILLLIRFLFPEIYISIFEYISNFSLSGNESVLSLFIGALLFFIRSFLSVDVVFSLKFLFFVVISMSITMHMGLSPADIKNSLYSILFVFIFISIIGMFILINPSIGDLINDKIMFVNSIFIILIVISVIFSTIGYFISRIIYSVSK